LAGKLGSAGLTNDLQIGPEGPQMGKAPAIQIPEFAGVANKRLAEWIKPGDRPMTFEAGVPKVKVAMEPFYKVGGERYALYWKVS
jgi:hypothetical protein